MPEMDGFEATEQIRKIEKERRDQPDAPPESIIIALTASALTTEHERAMRAGCNDFLLKPVHLKQVEAKISEWGNMQAIIDFDNLIGS
jgi:osomolarity two-component system response regulator SSK1